jgi:hypothetical protein
MAATELAKMFTTRPRQWSAPAQAVAATSTTPRSDHVHREHDRADNTVFLRETEVPSWQLF